MTRLAALLLTVIAALAAPAAAQTPFEPAIVVDDSVITRYDIDQRIRLLRLNGAPASADLAGIAEDQLIDERLKIAAAEARGLSVPEEGVRQAVADYAEQRGLSVAQLDSGLARAGADRAGLETALKADVLWRELIRGRFGPRAQPTETEIDQEIALAASGRASAYRIAEIGIPFGQRGRAGALELAGRLVRELRAGGDFSAAARRYSATPSARQGGVVGWVPESAVPPRAAATLASLSEGGVSEPLEADGGVVILKLLETRNEAAPWAREAELTLLEATAPDADPETLRARAAEAAAGGAGCDAQAEVAAALGLRVTRRGPTRAGALPGELREAVSGLAPGEVSAPIDGAVYILCDRQGGPDAEAREALREQIRQQRLQSFAAGYLQELRATAVIERR